MDQLNPETIQVAVYGGATMGALTAVILIVNSLKKLFVVSGQGAVRLTYGVAAYIAMTIFFVAYVPELAVLSGILIMTALLAAGADAIVSQGKTANSAGIAALKDQSEPEQDTGEYPTVDAYVPAGAPNNHSVVSPYRSER